MVFYEKFTQKTILQKQKMLKDFKNYYQSIKIGLSWSPESSIIMGLIGVPTVSSKSVMSTQYLCTPLSLASINQATEV